MSEESGRTRREQKGGRTGIHGGTRARKYRRVTCQRREVYALPPCAYVSLKRIGSRPGKCLDKVDICDAAGIRESVRAVATKAKCGECFEESLGILSAGCELKKRRQCGVFDSWRNRRVGGKEDEVREGCYGQYAEIHTSRDFGGRVGVGGSRKRADSAEGSTINTATLFLLSSTISSFEVGVQDQPSRELLSLLWTWSLGNPSIVISPVLRDMRPSPATSLMIGAVLQNSP
ncbi:hypothetical protein B0H16DRAFT_1473694 [Mycena metata]|uniref:Uncharacterized protein n=1 Tax=Mycena metata TaxID=1033252 RepID=A0AAD7MLK6_9AGAR|nr:hypothetical protein B0H16DRAFT_1473694 [Mycena metata]